MNKKKFVTETGNKNIEVLIDDVQVSVPSGTTVLEAAAKAGVKIPTLCHHEDICDVGICRVCVVEIEGERKLQAACSYPITRPISVKTHSRKVRQARKHILELLISEHYGECYSCPRNATCELRKLSEEYGIEGFKFGHQEQPVFPVDSTFSIVRNMNKCILCRRCIRICSEVQGVGVLGVVDRGKDVKIDTFLGEPLLEQNCINCGQCVTHCPTGALTVKDYTEEVWAAIDNPDKHVVIQTAPAPRAAICEEFGLPPGTPLTFEMNTALRLCGFDRVFDTNFAADLTIIEEGCEFLVRLYKVLVEKDESVAIPQFTSCSPGWIKYIEHFYPQYLKNVSSAKSPQQMFGAVIKTYYAKIHSISPKDIVSVSLMPCTAKKFEANRPEMCDSGLKDIDYALTTQEIAKMIKQCGISDLQKLKKSDFDEPFGTATGSGVIFGATGGVMESALRTIYEIVTGESVSPDTLAESVSEIRGFEGIKFKELTFPDKVGKIPELLKKHKTLPFDNWDWLKGVTLKMAVCHGTGNIKKVLDDIKAGGKFSQCHFIEFMACPGGCLGGGGQPVPVSPAIREARANAIYKEDCSYKIRKSHENPAVVELYEKGPGEHILHQLLHTHYTAR